MSQGEAERVMVNLQRWKRSWAGVHLGRNHGNRTVLEIFPVADWRFWGNVWDLQIYQEYCKCRGHTEPMDEIMESYDRDLA